MFESLIWIVPAAVALFGVWNPKAGLWVLAATLPLFGSPPGGPYLAALDVAAIAAIVTAWRGGRAESSPLTWPVAAFVLVSITSLVPSPYQPPSWQPSTLLGLLRALPGVETWSALYTWRAAADLLLGWGLFMAVRRAFAGCSPLPIARAFMIGLTGVLVLGVASESGWLDLGGFRFDPSPRLYSVFFLSGWLAEYIVVVSPVAIAALGSSGRLARRFALPLGALALVCLGLTLQRGAWVATVAQFVLWLGVAATRWRGQPRVISRFAIQASGVLVLTAVIFVAAGTPIRPILEKARGIETGLAPRLPVWSAAADLTRERPLLGWGLGSFGPAYELAHPRGEPSRSRYHNTAHSLYLDVAAERGLLGLLALGLVGWTALSCLRGPRVGQESLALGLGVGLLGACVYGLVQYLFHLRNISWLLWMMFGCVALATQRDAPLRSGRIAQALFAVALLLIPIRAIVGESPSYAGNRAFGFHQMEEHSSGAHRWTEGVASMRIPWAGATLALPLANGHPRASERPSLVTVRVDGKTVIETTMSGGWKTYSIHLGPPQKEEIVLELQVRPSFRPFSDFRKYSDVSPSGDIRSLGVAMREPSWE